MNKTLKYILLVLGIGAVSIICFIGLGLYAMEIEDHYGDLQDLYYNSKSGDIILNNSTSEFGIIEKDWKRINIKTNNKDSTDLYNWIYRNETETKIGIYRFNNGNIKLNQITYSELRKMIQTSQLELIINN